MEKLKPCPFCGGEVDWREYGSGNCHCMECEAVFSVMESDKSEREVGE